MIPLLQARWQQGFRTMRYPDGPPPELPPRFVGRPELEANRCREGCQRCAEVCPTDAVAANPRDGGVTIDLGRCLFCRDCETACAPGAIAFSRDFRLAATRREQLVVGPGPAEAELRIDDRVREVLGRALRLRQVSAGGCNACEADTNVLNTLAWDLGRFGIQFVASPRHADGLLITGPVTENMRLALEKTYHAVPSPKIVVAVGACAISGGPYIDHPESHNGAAAVVPVDIFVPGCPPHPLTILHALLGLIGRLAPETGHSLP